METTIQAKIVFQLSLNPKKNIHDIVLTCAMLSLPLKQVRVEASHSSAESFNIKDELQKVQSRMAQAKSMGAPTGGI